MLDIAVIEDPATAESLLDPVRTRLLEALAEPASATMLASRVGLPRQLVNYHLRTLERHGLVELETERRKGNVTERVMRASAGSYVISPAALTALQPDPGRLARPALGRLAAGAGGAAGPRRRRAAGRGHPRAAAPVHVRPRRRDPVRERRRPGRLRGRARHRGDLAHRPLPRRGRAPRPHAPRPRGHPSQRADPRPVPCPEGGLTCRTRSGSKPPSRSRPRPRRCGRP